ncbi:hypothetical protein Landi51_06483 [Colletotrichum acutatum]
MATLLHLCPGTMRLGLLIGLALGSSLKGSCVVGLYLGGTAVSHHLSRYSWLVLYFGAGARGWPGTPWSVLHLVVPIPSDSSVVSPSHPGPGTRTFLATPGHDSPNPCLVFPSPATWAVPGRLLLRVAGAGAGAGAATAAGAALDCSERESRTRVSEGTTLFHSPLFLSGSAGLSLGLRFPLLLLSFWCRVCIFRSFEVELLLIVWNVESREIERTETTQSRSLQYPLRFLDAAICPSSPSSTETPDPTDTSCSNSPRAIRHIHDTLTHTNESDQRLRATRLATPKTCDTKALRTREN